MDEAAFEGLGGDVAEGNVVGDGSEEGDAFSNEDRDAGDDEAVDEAGGEELLDGLASVHVDVLEAALFELGGDSAGIAGDGFDDGALERGKVRLAVGEDEDGFLSVSPRAGEGAGNVKGAAADEDGVNGGPELVEAVGSLARRVEKVEGVVGTGEEAVDTDAAKDGEFHVGKLRDGKKGGWSWILSVEAGGRGGKDFGGRENQKRDAGGRLR